MSNLETCGCLLLLAVSVKLIYVAIKMIKELQNPFRDERDQY